MTHALPLRAAAVAVLAAALSLSALACSDDGDDADTDSGASATTAPLDETTSTTSADQDDEDDDEADEATGGSALELPDGATMVATVTFDQGGETVSSTVASDDPFACNYGNVTDTQWVVNYDTENADPEDGLRTLEGEELTEVEVRLELPVGTTETSGEGTGEALISLGAAETPEERFFTSEAEVSVVDEGDQATITFDAVSTDGLAYSGEVLCGSIEGADR